MLKVHKRLCFKYRVEPEKTDPYLHLDQIYKLKNLKLHMFLKKVTHSHFMYYYNLQSLHAFML